MRLLIIENNLSNANLFKDKIVETGLYANDFIDIVENLQEGIKLYSRCFFDLVFTSLSLPDANGVEIVEQLVEKNHSVPIVVTNCEDGNDLVFDSFRFGAEDFLNTKEIAARGLKRCITHAKERKKLKNKLATALVKEKLASSAKTSFLANMSHEIRTPLNLIVGSADLLSETNLDKRQKKIVETFQRSSEHLLNVISDILDMSKIESGEFDVYNTEFNLAKIIKTVSTLLNVHCRSKGLQFICDIGENLNGNMIGDQDRLKQVLFNLLNNSVKFTERGYVKLSINNKDNCLQFCVEDSGIGVPIERAEKIFTSFYQIQDKNYMTSKGTGLGLAIVKELVNKMDGHIYLDTKFNQGARFIFELPNTLSIEKEVPLPEKAPYKNTLPLNILVAEDDIDNRELVKAYLIRCGHQVTFAANGQECVERFKEKSFDLVLMDIQMPKLNGYEATEKIRALELGAKKHRKTPIYALSANAFKEDIEMAMKAGCDGYLTKPVRKQKIIDLIETISEQGIVSKSFLE